MPTAAGHVKEGNAHRDARQFTAAIASYDRALAIDPFYAEALSQRGLALLASGRKAEALASCARATAHSPDSAAAWIALGELFGGLFQEELALKAYNSARRLAPDRADLPGRILRQKMICCDWDGIATMVTDIEARLESGENAIYPFYWQAISPSPHGQLLAAMNYQRGRPHGRPATLGSVTDSAAPAQRIRIGYISGELNLSPNGLVMAGVFDHHDRERFEIVAFDNGHDDGTPLRRRIMQSFDRVIDVRVLSDIQMADAIRAQHIDIAVDLNGFFGHSRSAALRYRPAPVQISYLGCPGPSGATYFDYLMADASVVPANERHFYTEQIVDLPETYYPTDRQRDISGRVFTRSDCGLPETGFVFCCFNHCHKIQPETFASWMRILALVDGSVLWLLDANPAASANLRREAAGHGVDPARLVFAPRMAADDHLARHRCADLFLDTLPYNAHTTATDALWAGLPVLTCEGTTFAGRVAASLLRAMRLPELIAGARSEYERRAVEFATLPDDLALVRDRLHRHRLTTPLFDTAGFTRHLETAYRMMDLRRRAGLPPDHLVVAGSDRHEPVFTP